MRIVTWSDRPSPNPSTAPRYNPWQLMRRLVVFLAAASALQAAEDYSLTEAQEFLNTYCVACHREGSAAARFRVDEMGDIASFRDHPDAWTKLVARVSNSEMPPQGAPAPELDAREEFLAWVETTWRSQACAASVKPPPTLLRRLNRDEYSATVRDLFDLQIDVSELFPVDGPGGEGFDNAAETLFLSPLHSEKYLEAAKFVTDGASKEFKSRQKIFVARPSATVGESEAAREILEAFLPRAFRRPVDRDTVGDYLKLFEKARKQDRDFEPSVFFALRSALVSPLFLFHLDPTAGDEETRHYALASKFSYFLWGTMPDELLFDIAAAGKMDDPAVLRRLVRRMLRDPRSLEFATRFVEQWLRTRALESDHIPDGELFPKYAESAELRSDIRLQPVFFFREVMRENRSLTDFIDSDGTILTRGLIEHMDLPVEKKQNGKNPDWMELPEGVNRGGLLSMPAVLAVSSHSYRTSPVLRGAWILDSILGSPPPPPPPNVPPLEEPKEGEPPKSVREMLTEHRETPGCASCHNRIDPLGFALENYDVLGRWRDEDGGARIDASGELPDGAEFVGPDGLKRALLERKEMIVRNLTKRMLGYALGRGLTPADACAVETIVDRVEEREFESWALVEEVVLTEPFLQRSRPEAQVAEARR